LLVSTFDTSNVAVAHNLRYLSIMRYSAGSQKRHLSNTVYITSPLPNLTLTLKLAIMYAVQNDNEIKMNISVMYTIYDVRDKQTSDNNIA